MLEIVMLMIIIKIKMIFQTRILLPLLILQLFPLVSILSCRYALQELLTCDTTSTWLLNLYWEGSHCCVFLARLPSFVLFCRLLSSFVFIIVFFVTTAVIYFREKLKSVGRKHSSLSFHNFNSHDSNFLAWQATVIENLCNGFTAASPDSPTGHTLILQTGAWDLSVAPIPRILLGTKGGEAVFSVLRRLLSGTLSCPNMNHFVFVTAVPYPVCYNDQVVDCEKYRGYRSNAAIAAMNQYMVNALVDAVLGAASNTNSSAIPAIHVSVVDAYSIIKPRLIFSDDSEVSD